MAKSLCKLAGIVFIIVGLAGFAMPTLLGFHLTPIHNIIHILTGAIAAYLGFSASYDACRTFCLIFGFVYVLLGILGFMAPNIVASVIGHPGPVTSADLMSDNVFHLLVGIVFLGVGLMRPAAVTTTH
jgi:uncharacterized membrane protein HdeD (DUF308 family)